jgi:membrane protease subunit HflK
MYIDTMQQIYSSVNKVLVDSRQGSNLLYLPLDKLMQQVATGNVEATPAATGGAANVTTTNVPSSVPVPGLADGRSRDGQRSRDRDGR